MEQPFFVYNARQQNMHNSDLLSGVVVNNPKNHQGEVISHFPGGVGNFIVKSDRMKNFIVHLLSGASIVPPHPRDIIRRQTHKNYVCMTGKQVSTVESPQGENKLWHALEEGLNYNWYENQKTFKGAVQFLGHRRVRNPFLGEGSIQAIGANKILVCWDDSEYLLFFRGEERFYALRLSDFSLSYGMRL